MPFVSISDPVEAHRYRQAGLLWFYSQVTGRWVALTSEASRKITLECQIDNMCVLDGDAYAILVESGD